MGAVMPTVTAVPPPAGRAPEPGFCSPGWGVSPCQHQEVMAWPWLPGGGLGWCWAGLGPHRTGSWGEQGGLSTGSCPMALACRGRLRSLTELQGSEGERVHLQGDGEFWLHRNSVLSSARSPGPGGPLPSLRHTCSSCFVEGIRATSGASSCTGSGAPRLLGSCRDSLYSSEKLLEEEGAASGGRPGPQHPAHPAPSCRGSLPGGELSTLPNNEKTLVWLLAAFPDFNSNRSAALCVLGTSLSISPPVK